MPKKPNLVEILGFINGIFFGQFVFCIPYSLQNKAALYEISLKENSPYIQGCVDFYVVITRFLLQFGRLIFKVAL